MNSFIAGHLYREQSHEEDKRESKKIYQNLLALDTQVLTHTESLSQLSFIPLSFIATMYSQSLSEVSCWDRVKVQATYIWHNIFLSWKRTDELIYLPEERGSRTMLPWHLIITIRVLPIHIYIF